MVLANIILSNTLKRRVVIQKKSFPTFPIEEGTWQTYVAYFILFMRSSEFKTKVHLLKYFSEKKVNTGDMKIHIVGFN